MPEEKHFTLESIFDSLYLIILLILIIFGFYVYIWDRTAFPMDELIRISYYYIPGFVFSAVGVATVKSDKSLLYALAGLFISLLLVVLAYQFVLPYFNVL